MNRPNQIRKAKSLAQKFLSGSRGEEEQYEDDLQEEIVKGPSQGQQRGSNSLFEKINKMFDDPSIKDLKDFDHDNFLNNEEEDNLKYTSSKPKLRAIQSGKEVLDRAKQLLDKKQEELPLAKEKQRKKVAALQLLKAKENTFVTGLGLYLEQKEEEKPKEEEKKEDDDDDDEEEEEDFDEDAYLKNLQADEFDDLAELRKMIAATKKEIQGYAGELYSLKNSINDLNDGYKDTGLGVDDDLFSEIDREFNRFMPGGDTNKLFDDLGNKVKQSQPILAVAQKKQVKKNNLIGSQTASSSLRPPASSNSSLRPPPSSAPSTRRPPIVKQPVLEKVYGSTTKAGELTPISGTAKSISSKAFF